MVGRGWVRTDRAAALPDDHEVEWVLYDRRARTRRVVGWVVAVVVAAVLLLALWLTAR
jgi:hypothetical protein